MRNIFDRPNGGLIVSKGSLKAILIFTMFALITSTSFQNCSNVEFASTDLLSILGIDGKLRTEEFSPEGQPHPPIDVTIILDNSNSMQPIHDQVSNAFKDVGSVLQGYTGEVKLYTTTQDLERDKPSVFYNPDDIQKEYSTAQPSEYEPYVARSFYGLGSSYTLNRQPLKFTSNMLSEEFDAFKFQLANDIRKIGTSGSPKEQGICTLARAIEENKSESGFHSYILATNEEDATDLSECYSSKTTKHTFSPVYFDSESCAEGEENCIHNYKIDYRDYYTKKVNYSKRNITENFHYEVVNYTPTTSFSYEYKINTHKTYDTYKEKSHNKSMSFSVYVREDNARVKDSSGNYSTALMNYPYQEESYFCEGGEVTERSCTGDEISLIKTLLGDDARDLVESSCKYSCSNKLSIAKKDDSSQSGWEVGSCSDSGLGASTSIVCSNEEAHGDCQTICEDGKSGKRTIALASNGNYSCNGSTSRTCNQDDMSYILNNDSNSQKADDLSDISGCSLKCSTTSNPYVNLSAVSNRISQCESLEGNIEDTVNRSCSEQDIDYIVLKTKLPREKIQCHNYSCSQTISTGLSQTISDVTYSCQDQVSCSSAEEAPVNSGRYVAGSCMVNCSPQSAPKGVVKNPNIANLCSDLNQIENVFGHPKYQYIPETCSWISGVKASNQIIGYNEDVSQPDFHSLFDSLLSKSDNVYNKLNSAHGDLYHLAAVYYPPDSECELNTNDGETTSAVYQDVISRLGSANAATILTCDDNYSDNISQILHNAVDKVKNSYLIENVKDGEWVLRVVLKLKDGTERELKNTEWQFSKGVLTFLGSEKASESILSEVKGVAVDIVTPGELIRNQ